MSSGKCRRTPHLSIADRRPQRSRDFRVLIAPVTASLIGIVGGCKLLQFDVRMIHQPFEMADLSTYKRWVIGMLLTDLVINWVVTLMIIGKLWWVGYSAVKASPAGGRRPNKFAAVIMAFVESGAILSITLAAYIGFWISGNVSDWCSLLGRSWLLTQTSTDSHRSHNELRDNSNSWNCPYPHHSRESMTIPFLAEPEADCHLSA